MARRSSDLPSIDVEVAVAVAPNSPASTTERERRRGLLALGIGVIATLAIAAAALTLRPPEPDGPLPGSGLHLWSISETGELSRLDLDTGRRSSHGTNPLYSFADSQWSLDKRVRGANAAATVGSDNRIRLNDRIAIEQERDRAILTDTTTGEWQRLATGDVEAAAGTTALVQRCGPACQYVSIDLVSLEETLLVGGLARGIPRWPTLAPDGSKAALFTGTSALVATVIDIRTANPVWRANEPIAYEPEAPVFAWSPDARWLFAVTSQSEVVAIGPEGPRAIPIVLDPSRGIAISAKKAPVPIPAAAITVPTTTRPPSVAVPAALRPSGLRLWAVDASGQLFSARLSDGEVRSLPYDGDVRLFGAIGNRVAISESSQLQFVDRNGRALRRISEVWLVRLDPVTKTYWYADQAGRWQQYSIDDAYLSELGNLPGQPVPIAGDRDRMLLQSSEGTYLLDLRTKQRTLLHPSLVTTAAGRTAIAFGFQPQLGLRSIDSIDLDTGQVRSLAAIATGEPPISLSPSGEWLALAQSGSIALVNTATGEPVWTAALGRSRAVDALGSWTADSSWFFTALSSTEIAAVRPGATPFVVTMPLRTLPSRGLAVSADA